MQKKSSKKTVIIIIIILAISGGAYFYFSGSPKDSASQLTANEATKSEAAIEAAKIITLLNQTTSLHIDATLFSSTMYKSLVDHTVAVIEQPVGKANPFYAAVTVSASPSAKPK